MSAEREIAAEDSIRVVCRFRPLNDSEEKAGSKFIVKFPNNQEENCISIAVSTTVIVMNVQRNMAFTLTYSLQFFFFILTLLAVTSFHVGDDVNFCFCFIRCCYLLVHTFRVCREGIQCKL